MSKTQQTVEITRCFGGGYELEVDGDFMGIFGSFAAAQDFAGALLLVEARADAAEKATSEEEKLAAWESARR